MHQFEGHHFASPFAPHLSWWGKQQIHSKDPVEIARLPTLDAQKSEFSNTGERLLPLREKGSEGDTKL